LQTLSETDRVAHLRNLCRTDLYFLLRYAMGRPDVEKPWLFDRCREVQQSPDGHLDLWAREHYKSTIITYALSVQDILSSHGEEPLEKWGGREVTIGIFSHTRPSAKSFLKQIKREFEGNVFLKYLFPDILYQAPESQSPKWSEDEGIIVKRKGNPKESTVEAWGLVDGQPIGKHFFLRVYDDVVTDKSVTTVEMVKKTTESWGLSLNLGCDGGKERYIGTRYADMDTYETLLKREVAIPRIYAATDDGRADGNPVFLSQEALDKKRKMGSYIFSCQMLQNPIPDDDSFFRTSDFERFNIDELPANLNIYMASDYAVSEGQGDYTEHGVCGFDENDDLYIFDWWSGQETADVWIDSALDMIKAHSPIVWVGEKGVIQKAVEPLLSRRIRERRIYPNLEWINRNSNKPAMARPFQGLSRAGKVKILNAPWGDDLIMQLARFPLGRHDDKVDVCALFGLILEQTYAPSKQAIKQQKTNDAWEDAFDDGDDDSWLTA